MAGKLSYEEKERLVNSFYNAVTQLLRSQRKFVPLRRQDLKLMPEYSSDLYQIILRFIRNSLYSVEVPRLLDMYEHSLLAQGDVYLPDIRNELELMRWNLNMS